jgi:hypothetical protein
MGKSQKRVSTGAYITTGVCVVIGIIAYFAYKSVPTPVLHEETATPVTHEVVAAEEPPALAEHKVIPGPVRGTTQVIKVIVQPSVTESEVAAINKQLISQYRGTLTHFFIHYFDDEEISKDYAQRVSTASEADAEAMFKHYKAQYLFNSTTGFDQLQFNVNGDWKTIGD